MKNNILKKLGPGLLFAGAAIGVSHLVQSTRAGAEFGFGLLWALILVNIFKYPFFQFGPRYALATGESLLDGYRKLGKGVLLAYFFLSLGTMFTIQTAVTIVTAGLAANLFGITVDVKLWSLTVTLTCLLLLVIGRYKLLDHLMKIIICILTISTIAAVILATGNSTDTFSFTQILPKNTLEITFLIAFMGWMPAPLDISIWHSLWSIEKKKELATEHKKHSYNVKNGLFDFNIGYITTILLGIGFVSLGALVMFNSGETFDQKASVFASQLINLYTRSMGDWAYLIIGVAAFTTMFSTTLTTLDASPRAMAQTTKLLFGKIIKHSYILWMGILVIGTLTILFFFLSEMGLLIKIATVLSFITAPFYAIANFTLINSKHTPEEWRPKLPLKILSLLGIFFLVGFSVWYLTI